MDAPPPTLDPSPFRPSLSSQSNETPYQSASSQPPADDETARHPPPRSFSQPQLPYHFHPRTNPNSAAPSILESALTHNHNLTFPRHLSPDAFSPLCASARTSYTRVDATATVPGTPMHEPSALPLDGEEPMVHVQDLTLGGTAGEGEDEVDPEKASHPDHDVPQLPQVVLTFLLVSGRRRTLSFEPETTIGRVKELVWNAWPNEWQDERPPAPSYLRILYLGKILQDDDTLSKWSFPITSPSSHAPSSPTSPSSQRSSSPPPQPTVVHLSIRAYAPPADDSPKKRRRGLSASDAEAGEDGAGCCSCIIC